MTEPIDTTRPAGEDVSPAIMIFPGDQRYDTAREASSHDDVGRPPVVAMPRTTADLQAVVDYARLLDLRLVVRGPGHDDAGSDLWGSVLVNTALMTDVEVDVEVRPAPGT